MYDNAFEDLKNAIIAKDDLNKLKIFSDIMEKMTDYIINNQKDVSNELLAKTIERQKVIIDICQNCYEKIINDEDAIFMVEEMRGKFEEYAGFVSENYK